MRSAVLHPRAFAHVLRLSMCFTRALLTVRLGGCHATRQFDQDRLMAMQMMDDDDSTRAVLVPSGVPLQHFTAHPKVSWFRLDPVTRRRVPHGKLRYVREGPAWVRTDCCCCWWWWWCGLR